jgi:hypothetical protein
LYDIIGVNNCRLILKNLTESVNYSSSLAFFTGESMNVRIDNCIFKISDFSFGYGSTIYATNSTFRHSGFGPSTSEIIYIENCKLINGSSSGLPDILVIKDSIVTGVLADPRCREVYLVNNQYPPYEEGGRSSLDGSKKTKTYIIGNNQKDTQLSIIGGNVTIYDLDFANLLATKWREGVNSLNLFNVKIYGGDFKKLILYGGQWENVEIYPPVRVPNAKIENLNVYNVSFPKGRPWVESTPNTDIKITESSTPFQWPDIHVPTPDELGLDISLD